MKSGSANLILGTPCITILQFKYWFVSNQHRLGTFTTASRKCIFTLTSKNILCRECNLSFEVLVQEQEKFLSEGSRWVFLMRCLRFNLLPVHLYSYVKATSLYHGPGRGMRAQVDPLLYSNILLLESRLITLETDLSSNIYV